VKVVQSGSYFVTNARRKSDRYGRTRQLPASSGTGSSGTKLATIPARVRAPDRSEAHPPMAILDSEESHPVLIIEDEDELRDV
jgi:hypothetical protein